MSIQPVFRRVTRSMTESRRNSYEEPAIQDTISQDTTSSVDPPDQNISMSIQPIFRRVTRSMTKSRKSS